VRDEYGQGAIHGTLPSLCGKPKVGGCKTAQVRRWASRRGGRYRGQAALGDQLYASKTAWFRYASSLRSEATQPALTFHYLCTELNLGERKKAQVQRWSSRPGGPYRGQAALGDQFYACKSAWFRYASPLRSEATRPALRLQLVEDLRHGAVVIFQGSADGLSL
jgi:hypothetical protein